MKRRIYMDHAATTPADPQVLEAMIPYFREHFGNASSLHTFGREAHEAMEAAREKVADLIRAEKNDIIFTSGGTESDNLAIKGVALRQRKKGRKIVTSAIEHPAVRETCSYLEKNGFEVTYLPVDKDGLVSVSSMEKAVDKNTILISIMHSNNEIGTVQPVSEIGEIAEERGVCFHTDAVQSIGKIPVDVDEQNIDLLSTSSHKIYGPKGSGALYVRKGIQIDPLIHGGGHEKGFRSSTENISGIVGFGKAAELAEARLAEDSSLLRHMRDRLIEGVLSSIEESYLNGHRTRRLPNNASFRFTGIEGEALVLGLDEKGVAASTGSACSSKKLEPSHVLLAIGLNEVEAHGSLRLTLGRENTDDEVDYVTSALDGIVRKLREISPLWKKPLDIERWKREMDLPHAH